MKIINLSKTKQWLYHFKDWLQVQKNRFMPVFWGQMVNWTNRLANFSQKKAGSLNVLKPLSQSPIVSTSVERLLVELREDIHQSQNLFLEKIDKRQAVTDNQIAQLESTLLSMLKQQTLKYNEKIRQERTKPTESKTPKPSLAFSENKALERISVELSNEFRTTLENHRIFDQKSWLALWQGDPVPCDLAKRLVLNYPPLKGCTINIYQEIADWLKKVSVNQNIHLIIPKLNEEFNSNQHEMVKQLQQKGLANRVQEVKRPGLACDDSVLVKAQVVSS